MSSSNPFQIASRVFKTLILLKYHIIELLADFVENGANKKGEKELEGVLEGVFSRR